MIALVTDEEEPKWERTAVPFIAALAVVAVVIAAIIISGIISPAEDNVSDPEKVRIATHEFVDARNGDDAERKRDTVCTGFDDAWLANRTGTLSVEAVEDVTVEGDKATAKVTTEVDDKDSQSATWHFVLQSDDWVVCQS